MENQKEDSQKKEIGNTIGSRNLSYSDEKRLKQIDYLIQSMNNAHNEILFRIKSKESWLRLQLLTQTVVLAIAIGINFVGLNITQNLPWIIILSIPSSLLFLLLYNLEDSAIISLNEYILTIPDSIKNSGGIFDGIFDTIFSKNHGYLARQADLIKEPGIRKSQLAISSIVFFVLPSVISLYFVNQLLESNLNMIIIILIIILETAFLITIIMLLINNYNKKRKK